MDRLHGLTLGVLALCTSAVAPQSSPPRDGERLHTVIGRSVEGRAIEATRLGRGDGHRVLVVGCIHGTERAGRRIVAHLRGLAGGRDVRLWLVSDLNPDGCRARTRQNARGVDLNRNFAAGWRLDGTPGDAHHSGSRPFSEPETRAARRLIRRIRPDVTIWYHQALDLVVAVPGSSAPLRRYARLTGLPVESLGAIPGTAPRWQNQRWPDDDAFVVELPDRLTRAEVSRHARAVLAIAGAGPGY